MNLSYITSLYDIITNYITFFIIKKTIFLEIIKNMFKIYMKHYWENIYEK